MNKDKLKRITNAIESEISAFGEVMDVSKFRELQKQLEKFLITDPLTGVLNRWKFQEVLQREIQSARRLKKPLCLMMIDVDNFKKINDKYGHNYGDNVLVRVANTLEYESEGTVGKTHHLGRWGGDEFLYICPLKNLRQAKKIAEKMRVAIGGKSIIDDSICQISVGIAQLKGEDDGLGFINSADRAMYKAKSVGGNRVELEE